MGEDRPTYLTGRRPRRGLLTKESLTDSGDTSWWRTQGLKASCLQNDLLMALPHIGAVQEHVGVTLVRNEQRRNGIFPLSLEAAIALVHQCERIAIRAHKLLNCWA